VTGPDHGDRRKRQRRESSGAGDPWPRQVMRDQGHGGEHERRRRQWIDQRCCPRVAHEGVKQDDCDRQTGQQQAQPQQPAGAGRWSQARPRRDC